mgnify:CR=1 FL=1
MRGLIMKKSTYSLILSDRVVEEIDKLAYSIKTSRNSVAVSSLYLLRYLCNMIQSRLRFEEKQKAQRTDKKLQQKINDKKQGLGIH